MAVTARGLRWTLALAALLLLTVVAGYLVYAHMRARRFLADLPARLGVDIREETDNFTYSQSSKGRTIFTVRASKELRHTDGRITLKDAGILLYLDPFRQGSAPQGRQPAAQTQRADRIHGSEFEYEPATGVLRAVGEVYLDLDTAASAARIAGPERALQAAGDGTRTVHVRTSGLVFDGKARTARTDRRLEFSSGQMSGHAVGAAYDSAAGTIVLASAVEVTGVHGGGMHDQPMVLTASRAVLERTRNLVTLNEARLAGRGKGGAESIAASLALVHLDAAGHPQHVEAQGKVHLAQDARGTLDADRMDVLLNAAGKAAGVHLAGKVAFAGTHREQGRAAEATLNFDAAGHPTHATLQGEAHLQTVVAAGTRQVDAARVELELAGGSGPVRLRGADAFGDGRPAQVRLDQAGGKGSESTVLSASILHARFVPGTRSPQVTAVEGERAASLERTSRDAGGTVLATETSTGDALRLELSPAGMSKSSGGRVVLDRVIQQGDVHIVRQARVGAALQTERARADRAVYTAATDTLALTGGVEMTDAAGSVSADRATLDRAHATALAEGNVRVSYLNAQQAEPVHILAARAETSKTAGLAVFTAAPGGRVRLWQAGSQVEAPSLELDRTRRTVKAQGGVGEVRAILTPSASAGGRAVTPVRIASSALVYADPARQAIFTGGVRAVEGDGSLRAAAVTVQLGPAGASLASTPGSAAPAAGLLGGKVERITAAGAVTLDQPGRHAQGDRLVYTAADMLYVLTGTPSAPPRLTDAERGTITGAALRFHGADSSVEVSGADGQRVRTETPLKP